MMKKFEEILLNKEKLLGLSIPYKDLIHKAMKEYAEWCCMEQILMSTHTINPYMSIDSVKELISKTQIFREDGK